MPKDFEGSDDFPLLFYCKTLSKHFTVLLLFIYFDLRHSSHVATHTKELQVLLNFFLKSKINLAI